MAGLVGMQSTKGVHPARFDPAVEFGPFLGEESAVLDIGFRPSEVDLVMRGIVIADHKHRTAAPKPLGPVEYRPIEVEFIADPTVVPALPASFWEIGV